MITVSNLKSPAPDFPNIPENSRTTDSILLMKLTAELKGQQHQLNFRREGVRVFAEIDERRYEVAASELESGVYLLVNDDGRVFECRVDKKQAQGDEMEVHVGTHAYSLALFDPKRLRGGHGTGAQALDGAAQIVAPMPGKIVRVLVEAGAEVEAGMGVIVVEAMKMQNEMKAPRAGVVTEIRAAAGATVNAGDVLAVIE